MRFVLFVEGHTERMAIPAFLKRWLDPRTSQPVGIRPVRFNGWAQMMKEMPKKAVMYLNGPTAHEIIAVIGLLDLYGPTIYPQDLKSAEERLSWAVEELQDSVEQARFRVFFAVHEVEAWLLSDPGLFPSPIASALAGKARHPEEVNFDHPPSELLDRLYREKTGHTYKKVTHGKELFDRLDPNLAYGKCPRLKAMLDEMLNMAKAAGL